MKISQIINLLEQIAPSSYQESYDNAGLIVGNADETIKGILISLDATEEIVDEAIAQKCNLIIAHHPIVFSGLKKINGKNYVERTVIKAIKNDIAIFAIHTNLDNVYQGVNQKICEILELKNTQILLPKTQMYCKLQVFVPKDHLNIVAKALFEAGAGNIGNYSNASFTTDGIGSFMPNENANPTIGEKNKMEFVEERKIEVIFPKYLQNKVLEAMRAAHPYEEVAYDVISLENESKEIGSGMIGELETEMTEVEFLHHVKNKMKSGCVRHTNFINKKIKKVAVCGGAGSFLLKNAIAQKADAYISADFKYHEFFDAENKILIADIGHYESEQYTKDLIYAHLSKNITTFAVILAKTDTNPIKYFV